jgi:5-methylcytosine-specific restriction endonuclease McrA
MRPGGTEELRSALLKNKVYFMDSSGTNKNVIKPDVTKNPGYQLRLVLELIFPFHNGSFIAKIDEAILGDEEFTKLAYYSSLNYLLRRLIVTSDHLKRKFDSGGFPAERYVQEIRKYLKSSFRFPGQIIEDIHALLLQCLIERNKTLSAAKIRAIINNAKSRNYGCYLCGRELVFEKAGYDQHHPSLVEVEHIWPRSLGGSNELWNLEVACHSCNNSKTDHIDYSDFHYEHFVLASDKRDEHYLSEFKREFRIAALMKGAGECRSCGAKAVNKNVLSFGRLDSGDSWHLMNISTFCETHKLKD